MIIQLIEAKTNAPSDFLLVIDGKVVSRWAALDSDDFTDLADWDNQAEAGADVSDYQAALDSGQYSDIVVLAQEVG